MTGSSPAPWSATLRWLAEFVGPSPSNSPGNDGPAIVTTARRIGAKLALALQLDQVEAVGIDMVNAAMNELLAMHGLPQAVALSVAGRDDGGFAEGVVAGIARACRALDVPLTVRDAVQAANEDVAVTVTGAVLPSPVLEPAPGDVLLALRGTGPSDRDHQVLLGAARSRGLAFDALLPDGGQLGAALVAPRASHDSVLHDPIRLGWPFVAVAIDGGGLVDRVDGLLRPRLDAAWDFTALRPLAPFAACLPDGATVRAAANSCSLGHDFVLIVRAADASKFERHFAAWSEPATRIGVVVARDPGTR